MKVHEFLIEADTTKSYEIQRGDTLSRIARDNSTTVDAIMDLNQGNKSIRDRDTIYAGGTIKLPTTSTGFDPATRVKRQGSTDVGKPDDIAKIGNQEFPRTKGPGAPDSNDDMDKFDPGIDDTDWDFPTVELGFGDPGYTPLIGNRVEKRPDGNWYYPGNPFPVRPNVARFAEKRLKDLDIVKSKDLGSQTFPNTRGPDLVKPKEPDSKEKPAIPSVAPKSKTKMPVRPGQKDDISPIDGAWVTDKFGSPRFGRMHQGIDLHADVGTPIVAPNNGKVLKTGYSPTKGNYLILGDMEGNKTHQFMHLSKSLVDDDEVVRQGQIIAKSGNTGFSEITNKSYPPHLHWEKYVNGEPVDPANFVKFPTKN